MRIYHIWNILSFSITGESIGFLLIRYSYILRKYGHKKVIW